MSKAFSKIIVPVDGSDFSKKAAKKAILLAKESRIDILAMLVVHFPLTECPEAENEKMEPFGIEKLKKEGEAVLKEIEDISKNDGVVVKTKMVEGFPDQEIIKEAGKNDLIIMGSKGISALNRIFLGGVAEKVIHHSKSTVMIVR
jgi:nucleotide-binding universal stress UspA family protein